MRLLKINKIIKILFVINSKVYVYKNLHSTIELILNLRNYKLINEKKNVSNIAMHKIITYIL